MADVISLTGPSKQEGDERSRTLDAPFEVPDDPKRMCLLHVRNFRSGELRLFLAKHVRSKWVFPDRSWLSNEWEVLRWALVEIPAAA
jgi:hypothetical protein